MQTDRYLARRVALECAARVCQGSSRDGLCLNAAERFFRFLMEGATEKGPDPHSLADSSPVVVEDLNGLQYETTFGALKRCVGYLGFTLVPKR